MKHHNIFNEMTVIEATPAEAVKRLLAMGVGMVMYDADALMFSRECRRIIKDIGAHGGR
jgi:hypothetical protein